MAAVLDLVPPAERGRRLAYVGMAFSLAAILIVPAALVLAQWSGWQSLPLVWCRRPAAGPAVCHLAAVPARGSTGPRQAGGCQLLGSPLCQGALFILCLQMFGHFLLIPHFANYFQFNLGFPREQIASLYLCGGLVTWPPCACAAAGSIRAGT